MRIDPSDWALTALYSPFGQIPAGSVGCAEAPDGCVCVLVETHKDKRAKVTRSRVEYGDFCRPFFFSPFPLLLRYSTFGIYRIGMHPLLLTFCSLFSFLFFFLPMALGSGVSLQTPQTLLVIAIKEKKTHLRLASLCRRGQADPWFLVSLPFLFFCPANDIERGERLYDDTRKEALSKEKKKIKSRDKGKGKNPSEKKKKDRRHKKRQREPISFWLP